ncbi:MAG: hypothetical protein MJ178_06040 [Treponemataceae bacterium]|nr:hypothetical protein [Treponemataceae bacterium]
MSILIKDTTREERERIVSEALEDFTGCGAESTGIDYQLYIDGIKELRELNMEARENASRGLEKAFPDDNPSAGCGMGF